MYVKEPISEPPPSLHPHPHLHPQCSWPNPQNFCPLNNIRKKPFTLFWSFLLLPYLLLKVEGTYLTGKTRLCLTQPFFFWVPDY